MFTRCQPRVGPIPWTVFVFVFFFSSRRRHTRYWRDWSSDVCSSDLQRPPEGVFSFEPPLIAVRLLHGDARLGGNGECGQRVGARRVESGHSLTKVLRHAEFAIANALHDALCQLVTPVVIVVRSVAIGECLYGVLGTQGFIE